MFDMNSVIANNIVNELEKTGTKQIDLANNLGMSKQTMSKIINGTRTINASELIKIAEFFSIPMEELTKIPDGRAEGNVVHVFMGSFDSKEAKQALEDADKIADMIIFHARVRNNATKMMKPRRV